MWIESHGNLARHPKTRRLMQRMGWTLPFTMGNLHLLWWWALDFAPSGDLSRFEPEQLTYDLDLGGATPEQFIEAMVAAGFLDRLDGVLCIHDWADYTSKSRRSPRALPGSSSRPVQAGQHSEPVVPPRRESSPPPANAGQNRPLPVPPRRDTTRPTQPRPAVAGRDPAVPGSNTPGPVNNTAQTFPARDSAIPSGDADSPNADEEQEPLSNPAVVDVPRVLAALPGFADTWWPKLLDIHEANGTPLSTDAQRELLASLAEKPFSAVEELRTRIIKAANAFARTELLNTS